MENVPHPADAQINLERGVNNYCHSAYDWSAAKDNPSIMYVEMGEETDSTYQVVFRSYTGAFVNFYVDKANGTTRMEEYVPTLDVRTERAVCQREVDVPDVKHGRAFHIVVVDLIDMISLYFHKQS